MKDGEARAALDALTERMDTLADTVTHSLAEFESKISALIADVDRKVEAIGRDVTLAQGDSTAALASVRNMTADIARQREALKDVGAHLIAAAEPQTK